MNIVNYLQTIYGYDNPIFINDIRIGGKSKTAVREAVSRAYRKGLICRKGTGVYYFKGNKEFGSGISFRQIIEKKYIYADNAPDELNKLFIEGYYSGLTFLNEIGISQQVPAVYEITTNKTSSKKRIYIFNGFEAIIRKSRVKVDFKNYKLLQFLDMFYFLTLDEVKNNKDLIINYAKKIGLTKQSFFMYTNEYGPKTFKKIIEGGILDAFV